MTQTLTPSASLPANFKSSLMWFLQCSHVQSKKYCVFSSLCLSSDKFKKSTYETVSSSPSAILPRERSSILRKRNTVKCKQICGNTCRITCLIHLAFHLQFLIDGETLFHSVAIISVNPAE